MLAASRLLAGRQSGVVLVRARVGEPVSIAVERYRRLWIRRVEQLQPVEHHAIEARSLRPRYVVQQKLPAAHRLQLRQM